jgi:hypothetical protein
MAEAADCLISFYRQMAPELARRHGVDYPLALEEVVLRELARVLGSLKADDPDDGRL